MLYSKKPAASLWELGDFTRVFFIKTEHPITSDLLEIQNRNSVSSPFLQRYNKQIML